MNRLAAESSPYLLQHAANPVDWYPWGEEAFARAREEDKPVFLSIGYATCHWCHVMEHESFEDDAVAALLNRHFVCIKVDREERPDIDKIYMDVTQAMTGSGGWPMTVFLAPDRVPFFAGTYFPKRGFPGRPGMMELLPEIARLWINDRDRIVEQAGQVVSFLQELHAAREPGELGAGVLDTAYEQLAGRYDAARGGFGGAPKFPTPHNLMFLLRYGLRAGSPRATEMAERTLSAMRLGGIWDHVGFGFHRYSTDADWLLPHFEKMLYDQALIALACLETWQATGNELLARTAREIFAYVERDLLAPEGAFYSAEDADSEGVEGKFYVWTVDEVREVLGGEAHLFIELFNLRKQGNFAHETGAAMTGENIPHLTRPVEEHARELGMTPAELDRRIDAARETLRAARAQRVRPLLDDKVLTDWNGLMIAAFSRGARVLGEPAYLATAEQAADFVLTRLRDGGGRLLKRYRQGEAGLTGLLDDYAFMVWGLIELVEAGGEPRWLEEALALTDLMLGHFSDPDSGGLFMSPDDGEGLVVRAREVYDGALPSGNSVAALNLLRLAHLTGRTGYATKAHEILAAFAGQVEAAPIAHTHLLSALDFGLGPNSEVVLVRAADDPGYAALRAELAGTFLPRTAILHKTGQEEALQRHAPFTADMKPINGKAAVYICRDFACERPISDPSTMRRALTGDAN